MEPPQKDVAKPVTGSVHSKGDMESSASKDEGSIEDELEKTEEILATIRLYDEDNVDFKALVKYAGYTDNPEVELAAITLCKELLNPYTTWCEISHDLVKAGIIPVLVQCLKKSDNPTLQFETAEALYYVILGGVTTKLIDAGILPVLMQHLTSSHINGYCIQMLGYIVKHPVYRDLVIQLGVLDSLLSFVKADTSTYVLETVSQVFSNLCLSKEPPLPKEVIQKILPALKDLINHTEIEILEKTLWAICGVLEKGKEFVQIVINLGLLPKIVNLLSSNHWKVQVKALDAVFIITTGDHAQLVIDCGVLAHFPILLTNNNDRIRSTTVSCLSNLTRNELQIQAVIDAGLLPIVVQNLSNRMFKAHKWAAKVIKNISSEGNNKQVEALIDCNVITPLISLLSDEDIEVIKLALDGVISISQKAAKNGNACSILVEDSGVEMVKTLQNHEDEEIRKKASSVLSLIHT